MILARRNLRYYYWLFLEFVKKHGRLITFSFFLSLLSIIGFLSVSPYLKVIFTKQEIIGIVGSYDFNTVPDEILQKITNGLVTITQKGEIIPVIANSWEVKSEEREYRLHLKEGLVWNDGKKFKADDIDYQFKDIGLKVIDDKTIDFYLNKPLAIFPTYLNKPLVKYPLVGVAGLYKVGKVRLNRGNLRELTLIPNVKNLSPIKYKFYNNESQLVNAYKKGEISEMTINKKAVADTFATWKNSQVEKQVDYSKEMVIFLNSKNNLLADKNIKDALMMAVDYEILVNFGEVAKGSIPPNSWAYNPNLKSNVYDLETAEKIIQKEITSSDSAKMSLITYYDYYDIADELINKFKAIGLLIDLRIISYNVPEDFDMFLAYWKVPSDPDQYYFWHSTQTRKNQGGNIGDYKNVKVDQLLEEGRSTINLEEREKYYFDLQKIMADNPPAIFLYYPYVYTIKRK
jgi:peptide/nickel transport system substrate-binding protein